AVAVVALLFAVDAAAASDPIHEAFAQTLAAGGAAIDFTTTDTFRFALPGEKPLSATFVTVGHGVFNSDGSGVLTSAISVPGQANARSPRRRWCCARPPERALPGGRAAAPATAAAAEAAPETRHWQRQLQPLLHRSAQPPGSRRLDRPGNGNRPAAPEPVGV